MVLVIGARMRGCIRWSLVPTNDLLGSVFDGLSRDLMDSAVTVSNLRTVMRRARVGEKGAFSTRSDGTDSRVMRGCHRWVFGLDESQGGPNVVCVSVRTVFDGLKDSNPGRVVATDLKITG